MNIPTLDELEAILEEAITPTKIIAWRDDKFHKKIHKQSLDAIRRLREVLKIQQESHREDESKNDTR